MKLFRGLLFLFLASIILAIYKLINGAISFYDVTAVNDNNDDNNDEEADLILGRQGLESDLFWFIQISDLHLSIFSGSSSSAPDRNLKEFCDYINDIVNPSVVVATGDLSDSKTSSSYGSTQLIQEWKMYEEIVKHCGFTPENYLDIRGNHDTFDVIDENDVKNYYRNFSVQKNVRSYGKIISKGIKSYGFIGIDATQVPGPRRPFNFIGILGYEELKDISDLYYSVSSESDYVFWFGHYPTSVIFTPYPGILRVMESGLVYLCGHFHTLHNLVTRMYSRHKDNGMLELEIGDWKDNRIFRILAVDHGLLSFVDLRYNPEKEDKPLILITNPKDATFVMPKREPLNIMKRSTHLRALVFGKNIRKVTAKIYDESHRHMIVIPFERVEEDQPLFVAPWDAIGFKIGAYYLTVTAETTSGVNSTVTRPFSLNNSLHSIGFSFLGRVIIMSNWMKITQFIFGALTFLLVIPLCILKIYHNSILNGKRSRPRFECIQNLKFRAFLIKLLRKLCLLVSFNQVFVPLVAYSLYLPIGPWAIGYLLTDKIGILFAWGMFVNGYYLPADTTYIYGIFQILLGNLPLTIILGNVIERKFLESSLQDPTSTSSSTEGEEFSFISFLSHLKKNIWFLIFLLLQFYQIYLFTSSYGLMATCGPLRLGSTIIWLYTWKKATSLSKSDFNNLDKIWGKHL